LIESLIIDHGNKIMKGNVAYGTVVQYKWESCTVQVVQLYSKVGQLYSTSGKVVQYKLDSFTVQVGQFYSTSGTVVQYK
jgi:hypothetical protein